MVPDYLNAIHNIGSAMAVVKTELLRVQRVDHFDMTAQLPIVITGNDYHATTLRKPAQQFRRFARRRFVVNEIAEDDKLAGRVIVHQRHQPF